MIDCGVILGTKDASAKLQAVIADIIRTTGGKVDVLAVTHEERMSRAAQRVLRLKEGRLIPEVGGGFVRPVDEARS